jgi:hypothetical protein
VFGISCYTTTTAPPCGTCTFVCHGGVWENVSNNCTGPSACIATGCPTCDAANEGATCIVSCTGC